MMNCQFEAFRMEWKEMPTTKSAKDTKLISKSFAFFVPFVVELPFLQMSNRKR